MLIECRRDLVHLTVIHHPHRLDHRMKANKLYRQRKMDSPRPDSFRLQCLYDTQKDTQIRDYFGTSLHQFFQYASSHATPGFMDLRRLLLSDEPPQ
jgi:hypothetical protein